MISFWSPTRHIAIFVLDPADFVSFGVSDPQKEHTIICNSLSKNLGLSGWRLGYAIAKPEHHGSDAENQSASAHLPGDDSPILRGPTLR